MPTVEVDPTAFEQLGKLPQSCTSIVRHGKRLKTFNVLCGIMKP